MLNFKPLFTWIAIAAAAMMSVTKGEVPEAGYREVSFDKTWKYADNAKITDGKAHLYTAPGENRKDITICVNAGHGTKNGTSVKTLCHPDGSPKAVTGSTAAGATEAVAISDGTVMQTGETEAQVTLKLALVVKEELLNAGYDVLMIRETDDVQLDNLSRTLMANHYADAHIALHYDSTAKDKGAFFCSVPDIASYKNMEPVKSHWQEHDYLGACLITGLEAAGIPIWNDGTLPMDLTQTSYSTIPSVDLELGDTVTDYSDKTLQKAAKGIRIGLDLIYDNTNN